MMKPLLLAITFLLCLTGTGQSIDSENSLVSFEVSNMKTLTVKGSVRGMSGTVDFRPMALSSSSFNVCLDAKTIFTDNSKRDQHIQQEDYLHTDGFGHMCFVSSSIHKSADGYVALGTLTLRGISKEVEIRFRQEENGLSGDLTIDRYDYDIGGKGAFMIGREVSIHIQCFLLD